MSFWDFVKEQSSQNNFNSSHNRVSSPISRLFIIIIIFYFSQIIHLEAVLRLEIISVSQVLSRLPKFSFLKE